jgi:hypothetical protein
VYFVLWQNRADELGREPRAIVLGRIVAAGPLLHDQLARLHQI